MTVDGRLIGGRYRLGQPIGLGRRGFVWLAHDEHLQRTLAARPVHLPRTVGPAAERRAREWALKQARQAIGIKHPGIVTVYQVVPEGNDIWLITEYVPSRPLSEYLTKQGRLTAKQTASLGAQLASALLAAQGRGLLHRSVEPANVLLADDGDVQLTDFGIGAVIQDPACQAPEVQRGGEPTSASDVFSLGATLFLAVEGSVPFAAGHDALAHDDVADPGLTEVLGRMVAPNPAARPTMHGAEQALAALARGQRPAPELLRPPAAAQPPAARPVPPVVRTGSAAPQPRPDAPARQGEPERAAQPAAAPAPEGATQPQPRTSTSRTAPGRTDPEPVPRPRPRLLLGALAVIAAALAGILFTEFLLL